MTKKKLGEILLASGMVTTSDIDEALSDQSAGDAARLGDLLIAMGRLTPFQLAKALSEQHGLPYMGLPAIPPRVMSTIELSYQKTHRLVPFRVEADTVSIAMADPSNTDAVDELRYLLNRRIVVAIAPGDEIDSVHAAYANAPAVPTQYVAKQTPPPTADELFGSLNLESLDPPDETIEVGAFDSEGAAYGSSPESSAIAPPASSLPEWLRGPDHNASVAAAAIDTRMKEPETAPVFEWSGKLNDVPPSRLIVAAVKALVINGVVTEQAILDALAKK